MSQSSCVFTACLQVRMDGSHGCGTDLRMAMPASTGAFFRSSSKQDGTMLLMGALRALLRTSAWKWICCADQGDC